MHERRSYERFDLEGTVNIKTAAGASIALLGRLENLSFGGFGVYLQEKIGVDERIEFQLNSPLLGNSLSGFGRVRHADTQESPYTNTFSVGVEFEDIDKDQIIYLLKRLQLRIADAIKQKTHSRPVDFIPY